MDKVRELSEMFGDDPTGRLGREAKLRGASVVDALLGEQPMRDTEFGEKQLREMLAPFQGGVGVPDDPKFRELMDQEGLGQVLAAHQTELGEMSQVMGGMSFEEMALNLGY